MVLTECGSRTRLVLPLTQQSRGDEPGKPVGAVVPPAQMALALHTDSKRPGIAGKPARLGRRIADIGRARGIAKTKDVKRIARRISKSMLVRFYRERRTGYIMPATLAAYRLLRLNISLLFELDGSALAHRTRPQTMEIAFPITIILTAFEEHRTAGPD